MDIFYRYLGGLVAAFTVFPMFYGSRNIAVTGGGPLSDQQTQPSIVARFPSAARITSLQLGPFAVHAVMEFIGAGAWPNGR